MNIINKILKTTDTCSLKNVDACLWKIEKIIARCWYILTTKIQMHDQIKKSKTLTFTIHWKQIEI